MPILLLDVLQLFGFNLLLDLNHFFVSVQAQVSSDCSDIGNFLVQVSDLDQAHDGAVVLLAEEDVDYLILVLLRFGQGLDLLRARSDDLLEMLPEHAF